MIVSQDVGGVVTVRGDGVIVCTGVCAMVWVTHWVRVLVSVMLGTGDADLGASFVKHVLEVSIVSQEMKGRNATRNKKLHIFAVVRR